jgi:hypothetical protein
MAAGRERDGVWERGRVVEIVLDRRRVARGFKHKFCVFFTTLWLSRGDCCYCQRQEESGVAVSAEQPRAKLNDRVSFGKENLAELLKLVWCRVSEILHSISL